MDWSWLGGLFTDFLHLFNPLKAIAHWKIWVQIYDVYKRVKGWEDWYKKHILAQMQKWQALEHQLFNEFVAPILKIVDLVRRITGVVGIFNKGLADRLNLMFLRVEGYLLLPFNKMTSRINGIGGILRAVLTPLGYFDRATMLNSIWRDIRQLRELLRNPLGSGPLSGNLKATPPFIQQFAPVQQYLDQGTGDLQPALDPLLTQILTDLGDIKS